MNIPAAEHVPFRLRSAEWGLPVAYAVAVLARTTVIIVIPTLAYRHLDNASLVSALYFIASVGGLVASMALPQALNIAGPWYLTIAAALVGMVSAALFGIPGPVTLIAGLAAHFLMVQLFETVTNVYALNMIARKKLARFELHRIMLAGIAYALGPLLGAALLACEAEWLPFAVSAVCALLVPLVMVCLVPGVRLPIVRHAANVPKQGFAFQQFLRQPRLRLAWILAIGRASWWQMFFVYTPILVVTSGISVSYAGTIASIASGLLLLGPIWGIIMRAIGLRKFLFAAYLICGLATAAAGMASLWSFTITAVALIFAALAVSCIDSAGNAPFMRAVKSRDRMRMVPIYNTYREVSQIIPTAIYTLLLMFYSVSSVFIVSGLGLAILCILCLKLPRRT